MPGSWALRELLRSLATSVKALVNMTGIVQGLMGAAEHCPGGFVVLRYQQA